MDTTAEYDLLEGEIGPFHVGNRTRSSALLAWFLETVWRLEPEDASDSICDGGGDKGIDALHVDEDLKEITVLQAKHRSAAHLTQGDNDLKNFIGTATYFEGPEGIDALLASGPNLELQQLVERLAVRDKLVEGDYTVRLVFVTNALLDVAGVDYLSSAGSDAGAGPVVEGTPGRHCGADGDAARRVCRNYSRSCIGSHGHGSKQQCAHGGCSYRGAGPCPAARN